MYLFSSESKTSPPSPLSFGSRGGIIVASPSPLKGEGWGEVVIAKVI